MSNDNKTLADAQPGGRVRLGDQAELEKFEAWAVSRAWSIQRWADGLRRYSSCDTEKMWEAWQAALSAQPSPGGQGDALALIQRYDETAEAFALSVADDRYTDDRRAELRRAVTAARNEVVSALAARQPVGEPVGYLFTDDPAVYAMPGSGFHSGAEPPKNAINLVPLYAAPPAQQPAQVYLDGLDRALGEAIDQRDRYHEMADDLAGHIAAITGVDIGEHSSGNCPWQNAIEAAEEYKPTQAVDLGAVRAALDAAEGLAVVCASVDGYSREEVAASGRAMRQQFTDALALIDSKAVGNG